MNTLKAAPQSQAKRPNQYDPTDTRPKSESRIQAECVDWFRHNFPHFTHLLYQIDNGAEKNPVRRSQAIALGLTPGIPDLHLAVARHPFHSLYIEMKAPGGRVRPEQSERHQQLLSQGHKVAVIDNVPDFIQLVFDYLCPPF